MTNPWNGNTTPENKPRVLVIDDSSVDRRLLARRLPPDTCEVIEAEDGPSGLVMAQKYRPDLILLDLTMPRWDGFETIKQLKNDPLTRSIPVIFLSAANSNQVKAKGLEADAVDYVSKPFDPIELRARVRAALRMKQLQDWLEEKAHIDGLTGLGNRTALFDRLQREWNRARRENSRLSVLMIDLDHFKDVNDTYGHTGGDEVLRQVAGVLRNGVRDHDFVGRFGGEEFTVLATSCDIHGARIIGERFRAEIAALVIPFNGYIVPVTASVGVSAYRSGTSLEMEGLLDEADRALYAAKAAGRNTVRVWDYIRGEPSLFPTMDDLTDSDADLDADRFSHAQDPFFDNPSQNLPPYGLASQDARANVSFGNGDGIGDGVVRAATMFPTPEPPMPRNPVGITRSNVTRVLVYTHDGNETAASAGAGLGAGVGPAIVGDEVSNVSAIADSGVRAQGFAKEPWTKTSAFQSLFNAMGRTVLVIDDSDLDRRLLRARLIPENISFLEAGDGKTGLLMAREHQPHLILLDLNLPDQDGFETISQLKNDPRVKDIPVIFLSAAAENETKARGLDLGAVDYVSKPFDPLELRARVRAALRTQHMKEMLEKQSHLDNLTALANRHAFDQRMTDDYSMCSEKNIPMSLAMIDLDHFKHVNDTFGHAAGDVVLSKVAAVMRQYLGETDLACRYGGEEFAVIAPGRSPDEIVAIARNIRAGVEQTDIPYNRLTLQVTTSIGVATLTAPWNQGPAALIDHADKALYAAKTGGRNAVWIWDHSQARPTAS